MMNKLPLEKYECYWSQKNENGNKTETLVKRSSERAMSSISAKSPRSTVGANKTKEKGWTITGSNSTLKTKKNSNRSSLVCHKQRMCFAKKNLITQFSSSSWSANSRKNPLRNRCSSEWTPPRKRTKRNCSRMLQATLHLQDECHLEYPCHTASGSKTWNQILSIYKEKKKSAVGMPTAWS